MNSHFSEDDCLPLAARVSTTARRLRNTAFAVLVGALAAGVVAISLRLGQRSFFVWPDAREQTYAWWQKLAHAWSAGYLPLWDANTFGGHSFVGEFQTGVFYPPAWIWLAGFARAEGISIGALEAFVVMHYAICAVGMVLLLRHWRLSRGAAFFGAVSFALIGAVAERAAAQPNIFFGLCWLPFAVLAASCYCRSQNILLAFTTGSIMALQVLAGHVQPALHTGLIVGAMLLSNHWRSAETWRAALARTFRAGIPVLLALVVVAAPQWLLSFQYLGDAYRWVGTDLPIGPHTLVPYSVYAYEHIVAPSDLPSLVDPWRFTVDDSNTLYCGAITLAMAIWFLASARRRDSVEAWRNHGAWLCAIGFFAVAAMFGHWTLIAHLLRVVPLVGQVRELGRYVVLFQFVVCVEAAFAVHLLATSRSAEATSRVSRVPWLAWVGLAACAILPRALDLVSLPAWLALCAPLALAALHLLSVPSRALSALAVIGVLATAAGCVELAAPARSGNTLVEQAFAPSPILTQLEQDYGRYRVIFDDSAGLPQNYADAHLLQSTLGHAATMYRPYFDFLGRDWTQGGEVNDLLSVRWIVSKRELDFPLVASDPASGLKVYERPGAYSRIFLSEQYGSDPTARSAAFDVVHYDDETQHFRIHVDKPTTAIVSEVAYPGWCARVNGTPVPIRRAQLGGQTPLRAVPVVKGDNDIEFTYRPYRALILGCD
jgi:hypothetical protein